MNDCDELDEMDSEPPRWHMAFGAACLMAALLIVLYMVLGD